MKIRIDRTVCIGSAQCIKKCPEIFEIKASKAVTKQRHVSHEFERKCYNAAMACPVSAIILENE